ncbi:MAG: hypothetical protein PHR35_20405 [Kiritimatiellae bacterium]|nr:hypothetical protein [Kiritimatiellia bacterium]
MPLVLALTACAICAPAASNAPVILKGIYSAGRSARSYGKEDPTRAVITRASQEFLEIQNSDGSWGTNGNRQLPTAFCLISLLRQGESRESEKCGKAIATSHAWLMQFQPKTDPERVATAIALSDYITIHYRWHDPDEKAEVPAAQIQRIRDCVNAISPQCGQMWRDLLDLSHLPAEIGRRMDGDTIRATLGNYLDRDLDGSPSTLDDYLLLHLCYSASFYHGGRKWSDWNQQLAPMLVRTQEADGLFPCKPLEDRIAATGLSVMSLTIYYIFSPNFSARAWPPTSKAGGEDIKIDVR